MYDSQALLISEDSCESFSTDGCTGFFIIYDRICRAYGFQTFYTGVRARTDGRMGDRAVADIAEQAQDSSLIG